jgi:hypothetical protein
LLICHCRSDQDWCSPKAIGYKPAVIMSAIDGTSFSRVGTATADGLTNAFVLHPVAAGLAFIAALCSIGGIFGGLLATLIAILAWLITLVVMVIDFVVFGVSFFLRFVLLGECKCGANVGYRSSRIMLIGTGVGRTPFIQWACGRHLRHS